MNVIFIMNDSFRRDHLGCYGNEWISTPGLDRFASHSACFDQCYIASYPTVPNRWDLCTGRFGFPFRGWQPLEERDRSWSQILSSRGVHTQIIWDTPMLGQGSYNYTLGFNGADFVHGQKGDPWITDPRLSVGLPCRPHKIKSVPSLESYLRNHSGRLYDREYCAGRAYSRAMDWLETNYSHESFFLWLDMWDPHEPFDCPWYDYERYADPSYDGERLVYPAYGRPTYMSAEERSHLKALYAGNVTLVDRWFGHFMETVEKLGLLKNTLIIWTTDHGHLFGDHDLQGKPGAELGTLYEPTTRIPLLVHHPDGLGAGEHIAGLVQPPDVLPTILEFLGIPIPPAVQGRSLWPLATGAGNAIHEYAFSSRFPVLPGDEQYKPVEGAVFDGWVGSDRVVEPGTITDGRWTLLLAPSGRASELYDLCSDPDQKTNVIADRPELAEKLGKVWVDFLRAHDAPEERIRPFLEQRPAAGSLPEGGRLHAFRDDLGQWVAYASQDMAARNASRGGRPGQDRRVEQTFFGDVLEDNPRNLVFLNDQFYWAEDLAR